REQIRVAAGEKLRFAQKEVVQRGCAIEARINAEDPANDFRPSAGTVKTWRPPGGPGVRLDSHVVAGYRVPPNYDSMVAKLLVHQPTRELAFAVMRRALREFIVEGVHTTIPIPKILLPTLGLRIANLVAAPLAAGGLSYLVAVYVWAPRGQSAGHHFWRGFWFALAFGVVRFAYAAQR